MYNQRIPGMAGTSLEPPGIPRIPWARPWDPWGRPWDLQGNPWDPQGHPWPPPARPWDPQQTPLGPPRDAPKTPGTSMDHNKKQYLNKYTAPEALDCCVRTCLLGPIA